MRSFQRQVKGIVLVKLLITRGLALILATMAQLTHIDSKGGATMVDVSEKPASERVATAQAMVSMDPRTMDLLFAGELPKGDVLSVARVAGILGAKKTSELIPLCHPLAITKVSIDFERLNGEKLQVLSLCKVIGPTGVEMEALTAASVAALTIYDMCKAVDRKIRIDELMLCSKSGGKSGTWNRS